MRRLLAAAAIALAGCESLKIPDKVATATAVACVDQDAQRELELLCPELRSDAQILELDDYKAVQALRLDRKRAAVCLKAQAAAIAACAKVPAAVPPPPL